MSGHANFDSVASALGEVEEEEEIALKLVFIRGAQARGTHRVARRRCLALLAMAHIRKRSFAEFKICSVARLFLTTRFPTQGHGPLKYYVLSLRVALQREPILGFCIF